MVVSHPTLEHRGFWRLSLAARATLVTALLAWSLALPPGARQSGTSYNDWPLSHG